jgi:hypothetical protein
VTGTNWEKLQARVARAGFVVSAVTAACILAIQQFAIRFLPASGALSILRPVTFVITTLLLLGVLWLFRRYIGTWFIAVGIVLNLIPIVAHRGLMPLSYTIARDSGVFENLTEDDIGHQFRHSKDIILLREDIHFFALSDRYARDVPGYKPNIYSLGDFVMFAGLAGAALQLLGEAVYGTIRKRSTRDSTRQQLH